MMRVGFELFQTVFKKQCYNLMMMNVLHNIKKWENNLISMTSNRHAMHYYHYHIRKEGEEEQSPNHHKWNAFHIIIQLKPNIKVETNKIKNVYMLIHLKTSICSLITLNSFQMYVIIQLCSKEFWIHNIKVQRTYT